MKRDCWKDLVSRGQLPLLGVLVFAAVIRVGLLNAVSFSFDEACSWRISQFPLPEMFDAISRDAHPPVFYLVMKGWYAIFGSSVVAARSFSLLCGLGTIGLAWGLAKEIVADSSRANDATAPDAASSCPVLAAVFVALSPLQSEMSLEARPYTLGTLLSLSAALCLLKALRSPQRWGIWLGFAISSAALSLTHYYALFTVAAMWLFLSGEMLLSMRRRDPSQLVRSHLGGAVVSLGVMQLCWMGWISTFLFQRGRTDEQLWMPAFSWTDFSWHFWKANAGGHFSAVWSDWLWLPLVFWGAVVIWLLWERGRGERLIALCIAVPIACVVGYGLAVRNIVGVRYLIFAQLFLLIGTAIVLARIRSAVLRVVLTALVLEWLCGWAGFWVVTRWEQSKSAGMRGAISYLESHRADDEPVFFSSPFPYVMAQPYLSRPENIWSHYRGDPRGNILSGPAMKESDIVGQEEVLAGKPQTIWTVDVNGLFGSRIIYPVPHSYTLEHEQSFDEPFGFGMTILLQRYTRDPDR